ncbi:type II toxin-antitoxin system RelE/ParE family toxin [Oscillatoria sp. FACHB-1406]|uniref:type II toxin-antitoxin system RelE/ParE family toxin n=1 Tax=Oscillatoria sp. FACHB-1406 TaxID=2692846 RepID=UPI001689DED1|nr:type II toxin-antitoxin system RelE/ParE family toxin [Oscillatoria sp. FACHB-1406]MBD2579472.1 type II toxin-antitoxin system RelE/ParE family toxin [Oscillatoria sp. FACHB-1406]
MTQRIVLRPRASQDLDEHFYYLSQHNRQAALLFFDSTRSTLAQIVRTPGIGSLYPVKNLRLQGLRRWAVKGFKNYLIFYFAREKEIEVARILYARQDIKSIFGKEE